MISGGHFGFLWPYWILDKFQDGAKAYFNHYGLKYQNPLRKP